MNKNVSPPLSAVMKLASGKRDRRELRDRPIVRIHLLGPMRATTYLGDNVLPHGKRARAVLGYLCLAAGEHVPRAELATLLWDRVSAAAARTNLRQALRELSSTFGDLAKELITSGRDVIRLNVEACWIDALAALALDPGAVDVPHGDLLALCRGELLDNLDGTSASFDRWLAHERTRVSGRVQALLERALERTEAKSNAARSLARALAEMRERTQTLEEYARRRAHWHSAARTEASGDAATDEFVSDQPALASASAQTRDRLRVGVLPFLAHTSQREENLAFSLSQEIAAALARFRWFDVIAPISLRPSAPTRFVDEHHLRRMNLNYAVDGTVSGNGKYVYIDVRLMELADYARPVWRECFQLPVGELHRLNELVTTRIVGRIDPVILFIEGQPKRREHYGATGLLLLAIPLIFSMERKKYEEAGRLIERALEIDPDNAMVAAWAAHWHLFYGGQGWSQDIRRTHEITQKLALRAIKLDPNNAEALGIYAHICSIVNKDFDSALYYFDRSLRLNPSLAFIWALSAVTYCYIGEPDIALQRLERYGELAPLDPYYSWFEHLYTIAYTFKGDYERAVIVGRRCNKATPDFVAGYKPLIASLGHLGRREEAKPYVEKLLSLEPNFTVQHFGRVYPFKRDEDRERYMAGLRLAGVPEDHALSTAFPG
jgi:DNA-binding SARP family transcriptional activator/TolB-like protein/Tfp pilus assembly protein PilF